MKLKVFVTDHDHDADDDVDGLVKLLNPTPSRSSSAASWTRITVNGLRSSRPTRSINVSFCHIYLICAPVSMYFTSYGLVDYVSLSHHCDYLCMCCCHIRGVIKMYVRIKKIRLPLSETRHVFYF